MSLVPLSVAEASLGTADATLEVEDPALSLLPQGMRDVLNNADPLNTDIVCGDPLVCTLSSLVGEDNKSKGEGAGARCLAIHTRFSWGSMWRCLDRGLKRRIFG